MAVLVPPEDLPRTRLNVDEENSVKSLPVTPKKALFHTLLASLERKQCIMKIKKPWNAVNMTKRAAKRSRTVLLVYIS